MQLRQIDEETGQVFVLDRTDALAKDLQEFWAKDCKHDQTSIVTVVVAGGSKQIRRQCLMCGQYQGNPLKQASFDKLPPPANELSQLPMSERQNELRIIYQHHIKRHKKDKSGYNAKYQAYLFSEEWKNRRSKVFKRAQGLCEGCLDARATEVHHLSYAHVFDELLFELVALCDECHRKTHRFEPVTELEWEEKACAGCRWGSWEGDLGWCALFEVTVGIALAKNGPCGPELKGIEPLK